MKPDNPPEPDLTGDGQKREPFLPQALGRSLEPGSLRHLGISAWATDRLCTAAWYGMKAQRADGSMTPGHNGPYHHQETPVRNTAHWAITFSRAWLASGDPTYGRAANRAIDYLLQAFQKSGETVLVCRLHSRKDLTNGLIGQAWAVEGLIVAGTRMERDDAIACALKLFLNHRYDQRARAWKKAGTDGRPRDFDWTFNHQLWFCAAGSLLVSAGQDAAAGPVEDFVSGLESRISTYSDGLIRHANVKFIGTGHEWFLKSLARRAYFALTASTMLEKSVGYHCFNTYAIAMIARSLHKPQLFQSEQMRRTIELIICDSFLTRMEHNRFGFPYNPPGIEAAYSLMVANPHRPADALSWLEVEDQMSTEPGQPFFVRHSADIETSKARIYELDRLIPEACQ